MAHQIAHPNDDGSIDVNIIDREEYHGTEVVQVAAEDEHIALTDESGEQPWVPVEEVQD